MNDRTVRNSHVIARRALALAICFMTINGCATRPSATKEIDGMPSTAEQLLEQADETFRSREYEKARTMYKQILDACNQNHPRDREVYAEALAQIARSNLTMGDKERARPWLEKAAARVDPDTQPRGWSRYVGVRGRMEWKDEQLDRATQTFTEMYDYCMQHELYDRAVDAAHMVAIVAPDKDVQIEWAHKGIRAAEQGGHSGWLGPLWNNLGWTYDDLGRHDEALAALLNAREYHRKGKLEIPKLVADYSVGVQHRKLGDVDNALKWQQATMEWAERLYAEKPSTDHAEWVGFTHREMGEIALLQHDRASARNHFQIAVEKLREAKMPEWDANGFEEIETQLNSLN